MSTTKTLFSVRYRNGTHQTQTVHGQRASSTSGYEDAARLLAGKLYPLQAWAMKLVDKSQCAVQVFELELVAAGPKGPQA